MTAPQIASRLFTAGTRISTRSLWGDPVWHLDGLRPGANRSDFSLKWGFGLDDGSVFTDRAWQSCCLAAKTFIWSLKIDPSAGRARAHDGTLVAVFKSLRMLIRWMGANGYRRFGELEQDSFDRFLAAMASRPGLRNHKTLSPSRMNAYRDLLALLYLQGARYPEVAIADPFSGMRVGTRRADKGWLPYTPDTVAVALVSAALRLIGAPADDVIALQSRAQTVYDGAIAEGLSQTKAGFIVTAAIATFRFTTLPGEQAPWQVAPVVSTKQIRDLVNRIYEACFVTVAYLVGARVSEILGLRTGCIEQHSSASGDEQFDYLTGRIYKTARGRHGDPHRWVAPDPVVRAIAVMEQLSEPLRRRTGSTELWLVADTNGLIGPAATITTPVGGTIISRLNQGLAPFIGLPQHEGKPWHLNTHQGRKTFARFVGTRDRTGLHALQAHLGHVSRVMTDRGYVGTDFTLDELIDRHAQEETRSALEELLTATALGGKGGRTIASRSQFRGRTRDGEVQAYVDYLMAETDLRLGVCDWGYCVYRVETSACCGDESGPNAALRTESTCSACANFAVTSRHRPVWESRRARNIMLLAQSALDLDSRQLAESRVKECDRVLAQLNEQEESDNGTPRPSA